MHFPLRVRGLSIKISTGILPFSLPYSAHPNLANISPHTGARYVKTKIGLCSSIPCIDDLSGSASIMLVPIWKMQFGLRDVVKTPVHPHEQLWLQSDTDTVDSLVVFAIGVERRTTCRPCSLGFLPLHSTNDLDCLAPTMHNQSSSGSTYQRLSFITFHDPNEAKLPSRRRAVRSHAASWQHHSGKSRHSSRKWSELFAEPETSKATAPSAEQKPAETKPAPLTNDTSNDVAVEEDTRVPARDARSQPPPFLQGGYQRLSTPPLHGVLGVCIFLEPHLRNTMFHERTPGWTAEAGKFVTFLDQTNTELFKAGRADPFRTYPIPWDPFLPELVDHCKSHPNSQRRTGEIVRVLRHCCTPNIATLVDSLQISWTWRSIPPSSIMENPALFDQYGSRWS